MVRSSGNRRPWPPLLATVSGSEPTRQAWSSFLRPSSPASAAWISRWTLPLRAAVSTRSAPLIRLPERASRPSRSSVAWRRRLGDEFAKVVGHFHVVRLERALERALQLALGIGLIELGARHADPCAAARGPGADVGQRPCRQAEREPDQLLPRRGSPREDAGALRNAALLADHCEDSASAASSVFGSSSNQWARAAMMISLPCSSVRRIVAQHAALVLGALAARSRRGGAAPAASSGSARRSRDRRGRRAS